MSRIVELGGFMFAGLAAQHPGRGCGDHQDGSSDFYTPKTIFMSKSTGKLLIGAAGGGPRIEPVGDPPRRPRVGAIDNAPELCYIARLRARGPLAQLVEQLTLNQRVKGSSPLRPTIAGMYITNSGPEAAGQPDHGIVADRREAFKAHVSGGWRSTRPFCSSMSAPTAHINLR
jgi:hypothetical protein